MVKHDFQLILKFVKRPHKDLSRSSTESGDALYTAVEFLLSRVALYTHKYGKIDISVCRIICYIKGLITSAAEND